GRNFERAISASDGRRWFASARDRSRCREVAFAVPADAGGCSKGRSSEIARSQENLSGGFMSQSVSASYKSPLHEMTQSTSTSLWNDSASIQELTYSMEHGAVGATCNPVIVVNVLKSEIKMWRPRIQALVDEFPTATEDEIGWRVVRVMSADAAKLLKPI